MLANAFKIYLQNKKLKEEITAQTKMYRFVQTVPLEAVNVLLQELICEFSQF